MAIGTKARKTKTRKPANPAAGNGKPDPVNLARAPARLVALCVGVNLIDPSPFQPRAGFPEAEIRELADSLLAQGQVQPVLLRPGKKQGRYELVDGERRWRAAKVAGLSAVRAELGPFTDAEARGMILASALQRADLNAIEEARAFKAALDAGDAPGPTELARQLGLSQGHVSNRLRLLELPADVQKRVISQEIPATHARELARFKEHPKLASTLAADLVKDAKHEGMPTVEDFRGRLFYQVEEHAQKLDGEQYDSKTGRYVPRLTPTPEQRAELGIVALEEPHGRKPKRIEFATNQTLWEKLQAKHRAQWLKENPPGKDGKKQGSGVRGQGSAKKKEPVKKKLTPAQEAARAKEQAARFGKALYWWNANWLRWLIAGTLAEQSSGEQVTAVLMVAASLWQRRRYDEQSGRMPTCDPAEYLEESAKPAEIALGKDLLRAVLEHDDADRAKWSALFVARMFWSWPAAKSGDGEPEIYVPAEDCQRIAEFLGIDRELAWVDDQAGPLSEAFWNLHNRDQLVALAAELKVAEIKPAMKKGQMVKAFLSKRPKPDDKEAGLNLPKELKKVKRP